ncbi:MAG: hypothetical protein KDD82_18935, partial [Planctomycetes bacterium]|nr:hypothetical protein [Planctomycetota bacterium]
MSEPDPAPNPVPANSPEPARPADRRVTAAVLKAAASNPSEMLEVLRAEARAKRGATEPAAAPAPAAGGLLSSTALFRRALAGNT